MSGVPSVALRYHAIVTLWPIQASCVHSRKKTCRDRVMRPISELPKSSRANDCVCSGPKETKMFGPLKEEAVCLVLDFCFVLCVSDCLCFRSSSMAGNNSLHAKPNDTLQACCAVCFARFVRFLTIWAQQSVYPVRCRQLGD